ncbi:MFS transporter, partial [Chitinimonas sp.]|uniref:MFS transporter n=1 Tax=Chitinimonas sp. TaxID=1934313 RepID=UPI0035AD8C41
ALAALALGVRESRPLAPPAAQSAMRLGRIERRLAWLIALIGLFTVARVAETFVILRARELGFSVVSCLLLWAAYSAAKSLAALLGGRLADRWGHDRFLLGSWCLFALVLLGLGEVNSSYGWWLASALYGAVIGLGEGVERAMVRNSADASRQGEAFGWYYLVCGLLAIPGGLAFGSLWQQLGAGSAFTAAALLAGLAAGGLLVWLRHQRD